MVVMNGCNVNGCIECVYVLIELHMVFNDKLQRQDKN